MRRITRGFCTEPPVVHATWTDYLRRQVVKIKSQGAAAANRTHYHTNSNTPSECKAMTSKIAKEEFKGKKSITERHQCPRRSFNLKSQYSVDQLTSPLRVPTLQVPLNESSKNPKLAADSPPLSSQPRSLPARDPASPVSSYPSNPFHRFSDPRPKRRRPWAQERRRRRSYPALPTDDPSSKV